MVNLGILVMDSGITGKTSVNVRMTKFITVEDNSKIHVNGFEVQAEKPQELKIVYNGLEYKVSDIEGHLVLNRVYR